MLVLALDTTVRDGSVALLDDDRIVEEQRGDPSRTHAERLPADIVALVGRHGVELGDVELFAVAAGPGSFTGLRVGIATMQGLALVGHRPLVGVSALEALAHAGSGDLGAGTRVAAWMDAHRRDVFAALYDVAGSETFGGGRLVEVEGPTVGDPIETLNRWRGLGTAPARFAGDGAVLFGDVIRAAMPGAELARAPALASTIGRLAAERARRGEASGVQPLYVRRPDAELARENVSSWRGTSKP